LSGYGQWSPLFLRIPILGIPFFPLKKRILFPFFFKSIASFLILNRVPLFQALYLPESSAYPPPFPQGSSGPSLSDPPPPSPDPFSETPLPLRTVAPGPSLSYCEGRKLPFPFLYLLNPSEPPLLPTLAQEKRSSVMYPALSFPRGNFLSCVSFCDFSRLRRATNIFFIPSVVYEEKEIGSSPK